MTTAFLFLSVFFAVVMCVAGEKATDPLLACNLKAISVTERPRYNELTKRVRAAIRERTETAQGFSFRLDSKAVTLPEAAEWIAMERLCCPVLTLQLSATGSQKDWRLVLLGPEGAKPIISAEFPDPQHHPE